MPRGILEHAYGCALASLNGPASHACSLPVTVSTPVTSSLIPVQWGSHEGPVPTNVLEFYETCLYEIGITD